jgi:SAM-dependent methyltransferase
MLRGPGLGARMLALTDAPNPYDGHIGRGYDAYIKRPAAARLIGRALWAADTGPMYALMDVVGATPDGSTVLDAPCGGGLAFRSLRPEQRVRYVAADLSAGMIERARAEAERRGLSQVELVRADIENLPLGDGEADLTLSMNSLHCVPDPAAAVRELVRCTAPGGRVVGSALVFGASRRSDAALRRGRRDGSVGPAGTLDDLRSWLRGAGLGGGSVKASGAIATFDERRHSDGA